jgi:PAS domain S-box-containing protein
MDRGRRDASSSDNGAHKGALDLDQLRQENADFDSLASQLFLSMFTNSPIGVYVVDDGVFSLTNTYFQEGTGYEHEELMGKEPRFLVVHGDKDEVRRAATAMLRGRRKEPYKFRIRTRSGDIRWIVGGIGFFYYGGKRAAIGYYMDVTEEERLKAALRDCDRQRRGLAAQLGIPGSV